MNPESIINQTLKACFENDPEIIQIYDEIKDSQLFKLPQLKKVLHNTMFNNGVFNRLIPDQMSEEQRFALSLWTMNFDFIRHTPNRYYQQLMKHYFECLNKPISESNYSKLSFIKDYYQKSPSVFVISNDASSKAKKMSYEMNDSKLDSKLLKFVPKFIEIGKSIQFNCPGFVKNELYYLLTGIATCYGIVLKSKPETKFYDLVFSIQSFVQLFPNSVSVMAQDIMTSNSEYNLSTALTINKHEGFIDTNSDEMNFNFRYKPAFKYLDNKKSTDHRTQIATDEQGIHLLTKLSSKEIDDMWKEFEEMFKKEDYENLIVSWFDSQCLTRSTCLCGMILWMIFTKKTFRLIENELMDWKAIIQGTIEGTYEPQSEIDLKKIGINEEDLINLTLKDVLTLFKFYIQVISTNGN